MSLLRTALTPDVIPEPIREAFKAAPLAGHALAFEEFPVDGGTKIRITHFEGFPQTVGLQVSRTLKDAPVDTDYLDLVFQFVDEANRLHEFSAKPE